MTNVARVDAVYRCLNLEHREQRMFFEGETFSPCACGAEDWEFWLIDNIPSGEAIGTYLWIGRPGLHWGTTLGEMPRVGQIINIKQGPNPMTREPYVGSYRISEVEPGSNPTILLDRVGELDPSKPLHGLILTSI